MARTPAQLGIVVLDQAGGPLLRIAGEIDRETAPRLADALRQPWASRTAPPTVRVDLAAVAFCDSSGLNVLLDADRQARERGSTLQLLNVPDRMRRLLAVTGTDQVLTLVGGAPPGGPGRPAPPTVEGG
ncbi:STAS domain-containing protein [Kitasatospora sp. NPDC085879]|uniref:STAS domain-containing protein n=1 Tax=Kitasatospora sp. NPDC085879 TaxID=3154769 RepID=UPI00343BB651